MKLIFILLIFSISTQAQTYRTFSYLDTAVQVGATKSYPSTFCLVSESCLCFESETIKTLDSISNFMINNPKVTLEITVHTDSRGDEINNVKLSTERAKSIENYLIEKKNISEDRVIAKGAGESEPIFDENTISTMKNLEDKENAHANNRRVIVTIISNKK